MTTPHEINAEYVLTLKENCPFPKENRLKDVRVEALLTGFKHCWTNKDFVTILIVADSGLPQ